METTVNKTWKPIAAGILNIITGVLSGLGIIVIIVALTSMDTWLLLYDAIPAGDISFTASSINSILIGLLILSILHTVFPIIGGVLAIQRSGYGHLWVP